MEKVIAMVRVNKQDIPVKVLNVFKTGDGRKVAIVKALPVNGREITPFTQYTMGGPCQSNTANIRLEFLKGISRVTEEPKPAPAPRAKPVAILPIDGRDVDVEVIEVYKTTHGERIATVRALPVNGKPVYPFMNYSLSRGNPTTDTARVPVDQLRGLSLVEAGA